MQLRRQVIEDFSEAQHPDNFGVQYNHGLTK